MILEDYLNLITSEHRDKPKFMAMVSFHAQAAVDLQDMMASLITKLDVDFAVGEQLDFIGQWVGISREVNIPISGIFFAWDDPDPSLGWDFGIWRPDNQPTTITTLPDDSYKVLIKAKIAANSWDGTTDGAYAIWDSLFPNFKILILDHQDMSYDLAFVGQPVDSLTKALITGGYIPLRPEGVMINEYIFPIDTNPLFGWDLDTAYVKGWDSGSWGIESAPT